MWMQKTIRISGLLVYTLYTHASVARCFNVSAPASGVANIERLELLSHTGAGHFGTKFKPNHRWSCVSSELSWVRTPKCLVAEVPGNQPFDFQMPLEVITRLFSYRHLYQARASTSARDEVEGWCRPRAWYRCRYENSRVITSLSYDRSRVIRQRKLFGICRKLESNFAEW